MKRNLALALIPLVASSCVSSPEKSLDAAWSPGLAVSYASLPGPGSGPEPSAIGAPQDGDAGADDKPETEVGRILKSLKDSGFKVRGATARTNYLKDEPASLQLRDPNGDGNTSTIADIAVTWERESRSRQDLVYGLSVEHHRNTNEDAEQDNLQIGGLLRHELPGDIGDGITAAVFVTQLEARYQNDQVTNAEGEIFKLSFSPIFSRLMLVPDEGGNNQLNFGASAGLVYQTTDQGPEDGEALRGFASGELTWYVAPDQWDDRLQVFLRGTYWEDLEQDGIYDGLDEARRLVRTGATIYLDEGKSFGVTLEHVNGENPETLFPDQEYIALSIALKI